LSVKGSRFEVEGLGCRVCSGSDRGRAATPRALSAPASSHLEASACGGRRGRSPGRARALTAAPQASARGKLSAPPEGAGFGLNSRGIRERETEKEIEGQTERDRDRERERRAEPQGQPCVGEARPRSCPSAASHSAPAEREQIRQRFCISVDAGQG